MTRRLSATLLLLAILSSALILTFAPSFWTVQNLLFGHSDRWAYFAPMSYYLDFAIHQGYFPVWNPLVSCGAPFAADPQTSLFYPFQLLRSALTFHPTPYKTFIGLALLVALHVLLAGVGTFKLARAYRLSRIASLTTALGFMLSAAMVRRVPDVNLFVYIIAWLPILLLLLRKLLLSHSGQRFRYAFPTGIVAGLSMLVGFPQFLIYTGVACAGYVILVRLANVRKRTFAIMARQSAWDLVALVLVVVLGLLIAAPMLMPAAEFAGISSRSKEVGEAYAYTTFLISPLYLLRGLIEYPGVTWVGSCGIRMAGAGIFLLAIMSLWHPRRRDTIPLMLLFLIFLDCSLAPQFPIGRAISWLAPFRVDVPARASLFACFFLVMLAGFGLDAIFHPLQTRWAARLRILYLVFATTGLLALLWVWVIRAPFLPVTPLVWILPAVLALVLFAGSLTKRTWLKLAIPILVFCEVFVWNQHYIPRIIDILPYPGATKGFQDVHALPKTNMRGTSCDGLENGFLCENQSMFLLQPSMGGYNPLYITQVRQTLCAKSNETYYTRELPPREVTTSTPRGLLFAKRRFWLAQQYVDGPLPGKTDLFPPTTTAFLSNPGILTVPKVDRKTVPNHAVSNGEQTGTILVSPDLSLSAAIATPVPDLGFETWIDLPATQLNEQHAALRLTCSSIKPTTVDIACLNPDTGQTEWGPTQTLPGNNEAVAVEIPMPDAQQVKPHLRFQSAEAGNVGRILNASFLCDTKDENRRIIITAAEPNRINLTVSELPEPRVLTFIESAYPGWTASVDGTRVPILNASGGFQAITLEKGTHQVSFIFRSTSLIIGLISGSIGLLIACVGWFGYRRHT